MAENTNSLSLDQYNCSVCLEVLKDPATIPCGHNYCMDCIKAYWDQSDTAGIYSCPQCRMEFFPRPVLYKNYMLMDVIGKLKQMGPLHTLSESYAGPNDVPCDVCTGRKQSAVKTCLTCLASYCEIHIQPHTESEALKKHKLEHPTVNLAQKLCSKHNKILEMFCRTDQTCICLLCMATEHINHNAVTTEIERARCQSPQPGITSSSNTF
uniref:Uncharacterized protein n=1 Tax=Erpetoichthys calabaricus TaxID=27687 RepID=A0A8C4STR6_ERPCA